MVAILINKGPVYRVKHIQAPDYYMNVDLNDPYMQAQFVCAFNNAELCITLESALDYARKLEDNLVYVEYGIGYLNYENFDYDKFMSYEFARRLIDRESENNSEYTDDGGYFF